MQYTENRVTKLICDYEKLLEHVDDYIREKYPDTRRGDNRIQYGRIEEYVNTSCHCHPEYEWGDRGSIEQFIEWINSKGDAYKTKHYTIKSN